MSSSTFKESGKRQVMRDRRRRRQRQQRLVVFAVIVGFALLLVGIIMAPTIRNAVAPVGEIVVVEPNPRPMADFNAMGDPNAPVKIIEYSDYQCSYCGLFSEVTEPLVVENYVATGQVYFEYMAMGNFSSAGMGGSESINASEAAYCAGDQGKFWEYHDILFANTEGVEVGSFSPKRLNAFAEALDLDMEQFASCVDTHKYRDLAEQGYNEGISAGVTGTPSFLINGKLIPGFLPFSDPGGETDFQREIEAALANAQ